MDTELERHFEVSAGGVFMKRMGPATNKEVNKKLCFTATDKAALVEILYQLSQRAECHFVKYSVEPKDGMYLGRCFLNDEQLLGRLWREYKAHPKVMCNVQDDDFTLPFR